MTAAHSDLMALDREAFIAAHKHLDLTEDKDGWGRPKFAHDMVQALWDGWHKGRSALRLAQPDREALARSIEGIILRRVYEKRIEGYTLEMSLEQADAILSDGGSPDEQPSEPVTDQRSSADAKASSGDNVAAGVLPGPSDPSPGPDVSLSAPVGEPRATKKVYIKPLRTIVEIQNVYADKIRDLLNTRPPAPAVGPDVMEVLRQLVGTAHGGAMLGGEAAYGACLTIEAKLNSLVSALTRPLGGFVQEETPLRMQELPGSDRQATEAEADSAIKCLRLAIDAAENSNQAGENAVVKAASAIGWRRA